MIVLDTNVLSEMMRGPDAAPGVLTWVRGLTEQPVTTVINRAEVMAGLALLPDGSRVRDLRRAAAAALASMDVCLPLTEKAADHYGDIVAARTRAGSPIGGMDALIAAIARSAGAGIATRDAAGFGGIGIRLVDPWAP